MARPTNDRKGNRITVRLNDEMMEQVSLRGSLSDGVREILEKGMRSNDILDEVFDSVVEKLGVSREDLIISLSNAVDKGTLYNRNGGLFFTKGEGLTPDYISVDAEIDNLKLSDRQKNVLKQNIIRSLSSMSTLDDTGNGGGL